ncbi:hypothetical protein AVEN_244332-1 [Araneus ventricosus]|uniref:Uncharacterized protein n=1 Tax=Araneus ventricosus TaxID=182803 RepID=A0A4Y2X5R0_ARAVE|nr:hypothetical protein AVEN_244332-1 [Araneus ventricosus]
MARTTLEPLPLPPIFRAAPLGGRVTFDVRFNLNQGLIYADMGYEPGNFLPQTAFYHQAIAAPSLFLNFLHRIREEKLQTR